MPLVLTDNEATESGIDYDNRTGVSYQYPKAYRHIIQPGERFVYYRGRRRHGGGRQPQIYFGSGIVGSIRDDAGYPNRMLCEILDYEPFQMPVAFKDDRGTYLESGADRRGYFQRGVRRISEAEFDSILARADRSSTDPTSGVASPVRPTSPSYASTELARAVEAYSVEVAVAELRRRHPDSVVASQHRNNPGFDVLVTAPGKTLFVEVKGTQRPSPHFFVTEGELQFSRAHSSQFWLVVVYRINLDSHTYRLYWHQGDISLVTGFGLRPVQWVCVTVPGETNDV